MKDMAEAEVEAKVSIIAKATVDYLISTGESYGPTAQHIHKIV